MDAALALAAGSVTGALVAQFGTGQVTPVLDGAGYWTAETIVVFHGRRWRVTVEPLEP